MRKAILLFAFLLIQLNSYSQERKITVVIDTLEMEGEYEDFWAGINGHVFGYHDITNLSDSLLHYDPKNYPNFSCNVFVKDTNEAITIALDNQGNYLEFVSLPHLKQDTIKIDRLLFAKMCNHDTLVSETVYWLESDTGLVEPPIRVKYKREAVHPKCKQKFPKTLSVTVNGMTQNLKTRTFDGMVEVTTFYGHKPKRYSRHREKYKRRRKIYFHGSRNLRRSHYKVQFPF